MEPIKDRTIKACEIHFKGCDCREKKFNLMYDQVIKAHKLLNDPRLRFKCKCNNGYVCLKHEIEKVKTYLKF